MLANNRNKSIPERSLSKMTIFINSFEDSWQHSYALKLQDSFWPISSTLEVIWKLLPVRMEILWVSMFLTVSSNWFKVWMVQRLGSQLACRLRAWPVKYQDFLNSTFLNSAQCMDEAHSRPRSPRANISEIWKRQLWI